MSTLDERNVDPIQEMTRIARNFLDLNHWSFKESYSSREHGELIYDSQWCRVNLTWGGWDYGSGNSISIYYGRLHASNDKSTMTWNGEECRCWHSLENPLYFLDGYSPANAVRMMLSHPSTDPFYEEEFRQQFRRRQPEWLAQMHSTVWKHYGKRFFELFDLRRPDLWKQYRQFLKDFYDIEGRIPEIKPSLDRVC